MPLNQLIQYLIARSLSWVFKLKYMILYIWFCTACDWHLIFSSRTFGDLKTVTERDMMGRISLFILLIHFASMCWAFLPNFWSRVLTLSWDSYTHQYMTEQALLNITVETINMMPEHFGGQEQVRAAGWCYTEWWTMWCLESSQPWIYPLIEQIHIWWSKKAY